VYVLGNEELLCQGNRFARALDASGTTTRAAVAVLCSNRPEMLAVYRGTTYSGRRFTPMSTRWSADDVAYVIDNCEAEVLVADARYADVVGDAARLVAPERRFAIGGHIDGFRPWSDVLAESGEAYPHLLAGTNMTYTSGTTGRPKGVFRPSPEGQPPGPMGRGGSQMMMLCLRAGATRQAQTAGCEPQVESRLDGSHLITTPLYHAAPMGYADGAALLGSDLVIMDRFDPEESLRLIEAHRVSSTFMVPTQLVRLLRLPDEVRERYDLSSLRILIHGAAPIAPDVKRTMIDWFGPILYEFYGGSEGGGVFIDSHDWLAHPGSVGRPMPGLSLEIRDDDHQLVPAGTPGQIWMRGAKRFEYKGDPEKTAEAWNGETFTLGDIGYLDDDGFLYLCDRRADLIITGGVNVYPARVEAVLLGHHAVADCCVVGVPDDEWGEVVRAVVQPVDGQHPSDELATELLAHCQSLNAVQRPRQIDFDANLPRTETGKLGRRAIRDRYWAGRQRKI